MRGVWATSGFIEIACRLGWARATGALELVENGARHHLFLRQGDVVSFKLADPIQIGQLIRKATSISEARFAELLATVRPGQPLGQLLVNEHVLTHGEVERLLALQSKLRLDHLHGRPGGSYVLDASAGPPDARSRVRPVSLLAWARAKLEARYDARDHDLGRDRKSVVRLIDTQIADPAMLSRAERQIARLLKQPRSIAELVSQTTDRDVVVFLWLLDHAGVLDVDLAGTPTPAPVMDARSLARQLLGVVPGATRSAVRQAFRRLVRERHPDRHPHASAVAIRHLTDELARLNAAYKLLSE